MGTRAIVFWFYDHIPLCVRRVQELRARNPNTPVYGVYGGHGDPGPVAELCDDCYTYQGPEDRDERWRQGDRILRAWYQDRGHQLDWDSCVVVQWDLLVQDPIDTVFSGIPMDTLVLSGLRPAQELAGWWGWLDRKNPDKGSDLERFEQWMQEQGIQPELWACLFVVAVLPRGFWARYTKEAPEAGFLEYKIPTLAKAWGIPCYQDPTKQFWPWWAKDPTTQTAPGWQRVLSAAKEAVTLDMLLEAQHHGRPALAHPWYSF